jgi:hypothetical protein
MHRDMFAHRRTSTAEGDRDGVTRGAWRANVFCSGRFNSAHAPSLFCSCIPAAATEGFGLWRSSNSGVRYLSAEPCVLVWYRTVPSNNFVTRITMYEQEMLKLMRSSEQHAPETWPPHMLPFASTHTCICACASRDLTYVRARAVDAEGNLSVVDCDGGSVWEWDAQNGIDGTLAHSFADYLEKCVRHST